MEGMHISGGAILLARQLLESEIWTDKPAWWFKVWCYIIAHVNHKDQIKVSHLDNSETRKTQPERRRRGANYFTYSQIYEGCFLSQDGVRRKTVGNVINWLKSQDMIKTQQGQRGLVITVLNYDTYQTLDNYYKRSTEPTDKKEPSSLQEADKTPYNKNVKNGKYEEGRKEEAPAFSPQKPDGKYAGAEGQEFEDACHEVGDDIEEEYDDNYVEDRFKDAHDGLIEKYITEWLAGGGKFAEAASKYSIEEWMRWDKRQEFKETAAKLLNMKWRNPPESLQEKEAG